MALADDIRNLQEESLAALDASHDYYTHTKYAWRLVQRVVRQDHEVRIRNQETGSIVHGHELPGLAQEYVTGYLASATFQHFVSLFEHFLIGFLRLWLIEHPGSLSAKQIGFETVLQSRDKGEIVRSVVEKELHGLAYKRIEDWFKYIERIAGLGCPHPNQIERLAEIKASRDVLVHNQGIANAIYIEKSVGLARFQAGETLEIPYRYHLESWQLIKQVVADIAGAAIAKFSPPCQV